MPPVQVGDRVVITYSKPHTIALHPRLDKSALLFAHNVEQSLDYIGVATFVEKIDKRRRYDVHFKGNGNRWMLARSDDGVNVFVAESRWSHAIARSDDRGLDIPALDYTPEGLVVSVEYLDTIREENAKLWEEDETAKMLAFDLSSPEAQLRKVVVALLKDDRSLDEYTLSRAAFANAGLSEEWSNAFRRVLFDLGEQVRTAREEATRLAERIADQHKYDSERYERFVARYEEVE